jgi:Fe-S-cluster containining protein
VSAAISVGCPGACCVRFPMSTTYEDLLAIRDNRRPGNTRTGDGRYFVDLIVPVDHSSTLRNDSDGIIYTCRALDRKTMRCKIYDARPGLCADYPYRGYCAWCTFDPAKPEDAVSLRTIEDLVAQRSPRALETGIFDAELVDVLIAVA